MLKEIGSDFWENPESIQESEKSLKGIEQYKDIQYYISGRSAIFAFTKAISGIDKRILIPAYNCETVIIPFEKDGWEIVFYPVQKTLKPDNGKLIRLIESFEPSVLLLQNYFGFNTLIEIAEILKLCKERQIIVIEDITQCLFSSYPKCKADYYVSSLRKFIAIPEGGILISRTDVINVETKQPHPYIADVAKKAFSDKKSYINGEKDISKDIFIKEYSELKEIIKNFDEVHQMNKETQKMLGRIDTKVICEKRRNNYLRLYDGLKQLKSIACIFVKLHEQEVPLYFPIYVKKSGTRNIFQTRLAEKNIYCPIIWPQYIKSEFLDADSQYIYDHILCIPCDQRYGEEEMNYIIKTMHELEEL